ncbi:MAG: PilZ domain-containing protein [Clostridiales bacterium]|nr:PilZ domain-containing protein [Clostridiales bacterium]MCF8021703.1 PilZ domain-containing protein [Clostridiales bacterium]
MAGNIEIPTDKKISVSADGRDWYVTSVEKKESGGFYIGLPYQSSKPLILIAGDTVACKFSGQDSTYSFSTRVINQVKDQITMYILAFPETIERVQQRNFVRVPVTLPVKYAVEQDKGKKNKFKNATSIDLSSGGMKLAVKEYLNYNTILYLVFELEVNKKLTTFEVMGRIVRVEAVKIGENYYIYHLGVKFLELSRAVQDKIMAYLFSLMARQKRLQ